VQAKHLLPKLKALGYEVAQFAWYGLSGAVIETPDFRVYPAFRDPWGVDIVQGHIKHFKADLVISLQDIWVLPPNYGDMIREAGAAWCCWFPVDHDPIPSLVLERAQTADYPVNYARFGQESAKATGLDCPYIPHGVSDVFLQADTPKTEARAKLKLPEDGYIVSMVAANKSMPSRKAFPENLQAFARFAEDHPEALLYLHTNEQDSQGVDFRKLIPACGINPASVRFPDQYLRATGMLDEGYMALVYRASDALLAASMSEGFGIPILEAQAAGCPVITTAFTSMTELTWNGIATEPVQRAWTPLDSWVAVPSIDNIHEALEQVYSWGESEQSAQARGGKLQAQRYSWDRVVENYWKPFLERVETELVEKKRPHRWAPIGIYNTDGSMSTPCLDCDAEQRNGVVIPHGFPMSICGTDLDIEDDPDVGIARIVCREATKDYQLDQIDFRPDDTVIEIGAHVGEIASWFAKVHPEVRVWAYEPILANYKRAERNLEANGWGRVILIDRAITGDGRKVTLGTPDGNSGGASIFAPGKPVRSIAARDELDFDDQVRLLIIDCEGAEYEILRAYPEILDHTDYICGEFHQVDGEDPIALLELVKQHIDPDHVRIKIQGGAA